MEEIQELRLTEYSHGAGCGCKISPADLSRILGQSKGMADPRLLIGHDTRDDAAVYLLRDDLAIVSTTDFFMPIVDDPHDFGGIASVNAISDIYAMGARPMMAIAILGWPLDKLAPEIAAQVIEGARAACARAGITLAGGHSIDAPEPIFGLAVTGSAHPDEIKSNAQARPGAELYLSKPLGVGILSTAQKKGKLREEDLALARNSMLKLNDAGPEFAQLDAVQSITDVTGFGLLGHLIEMAEGSGLHAHVDPRKVPRFDTLDGYLEAGCIPGGTHRNFKSYGHHVEPLADELKFLLCDPQTSGGLLLAVDPEGRDAFAEVAASLGMDLQPFGYLAEQGEHRVNWL